MLPISPASFPNKRIVVIGVTGCGKSVLAEQLARKLNLDFIELDALYWLPEWEHCTDDEFRAKVAANPEWTKAYGDAWETIARTEEKAKPEKREVTVGKRNEKQVEILSGLREGEEVLLERPAKE